jgi:hypothetical protein
LNDDIFDINEVDYINLIDINIFYILLNDLNEIDG